MKKVLLTTIYCVSILYVPAQVLFGTTFGGGSDKGGTINRFIPATNNLVVAKSLEGLPTFDPFFTNFVQATDGKLYGMAVSAGSFDAGVIFSFDASSSTYTRLKDFDVNDGRYPYGSLIQASDGKLYGMTSSGGSNDAGVIFSFDPSSSTYTRLIDFDETNGRDPHGNLIQANDGKLYGMTSSGGISNLGVIFSFDLSTSVYTKLKDFDAVDGANPSGNLIQASDGKLYGMTTDGLSGGNSEFGVIFSFDPATFTYTRLMNFDEPSGANPHGSLIEAADGKLYGMTSSGGSNSVGVIFSFDPSSFSYTKLQDFDDTNGNYPSGSLVQASDGKLYGMAFGGTNFNGVIFSFDPLTLTYKKLRDFTYDDGGGSSGSLFQASDGKLYGMTNRETVANGVIFSFDPSSSVYTKLKDFTFNESGTYVSGILAKAADGKLYGLSNQGGSYGYGVIFSFDPSGFTYTKLKDFDNINGANPYGSLMQASDRKLYGMTHGGGSNGVGVIFSYDPLSSTYTKLKDFDQPGGAIPSGSLMQASNGKLYGMTYSGGSNYAGVIFSFDPVSSTYTNLKDFDNTNGWGPEGNLVQASNGKLYGMTLFGGSSDAGIIFSFDPSTLVYTKVKDFDIINGGYPSASLIQASDGKLYGVTLNGGGNSNGGVIFSFDPLSSTYTKLKDFDDTNGYPSGSLIQASDGKIYGMLSQGGSVNDGLIFSFDPSTSTYTTLKEYNGDNGANPNYGSGFIEVNVPLPVTLIGFTGKNNGNQNQLSWEVESEQNLDYYELQRSVNGRDFERIYQMSAIGNHSYVYNDPLAAAVASLYYYRLKSVDKDGNFKFSLIIKISTTNNGFAMVNPNPFADKLIIKIQRSTQGKATLIVTDTRGKLMLSQNTSLSPGSNLVEVKLTRKLPKGMYLLTVIDSQHSQTIKVVKGN